ncbi:RNA-directed DNA polymerase, eukaryota, reverse transcriptase zinc-binding domain protein [Tanacetum coccineum]
MGRWVAGKCRGGWGHGTGQWTGEGAGGGGEVGMGERLGFWSEWGGEEEGGGGDWHAGVGGGEGDVGRGRGAEDVQYRDLYSHTSKVLLLNMSDRWAWTLSTSEDFSVSSTRSYIDDVLLPKSDVPTRWVKMVPIKVNILAWKMNLDGLPTRLNLFSRSVEIPLILCPVCNEVVESSSRILLSCYFSRQVNSRICR